MKYIYLEGLKNPYAWMYRDGGEIGDFAMVPDMDTPLRIAAVSSENPSGIRAGDARPCWLSDMIKTGSYCGPSGHFWGSYVEDPETWKEMLMEADKRFDRGDALGVASYRQCGFEYISNIDLRGDYDDIAYRRAPDALPWPGT